MKIDVDEGELERIVKGLEQYYAYTIAANREDVGYKNLADRLKKKSVESEGKDVRKVRQRG
jgi:hypothetical protein